MDTANEHPKVCHKFVRIKLLVKEHLIKLRDLEGRIVEERICKEPNKFQIVFPL